MDDWVVKADHNGYWLHAGRRVVVAQIGRSGVIRAADKREETRYPLWALAGTGGLLSARPGAVSGNDSSLSPLTVDCGWCDDVTSPDYNRYVKRPCDFRHEQMWRHDEAYDFVVELGYNDDPVVTGHGSAIFLHCTAAGRTSTAGCVAVNQADLAGIIESASANQNLLIPEALLTS